MAELPIPETKFCSKCGETKPIAGFSRDKSKKDGFALNCRSCRKLYNDRWYQRTEGPARRAGKRKAERRASLSKYYQTHKSDFQAYQRKWVNENRDAHRERTKLAMRRRRATVKGRLESNVARAVNRALRGRKNGEPAFDLLGFSVEQLIAHLEKQFLPGMSWGNYGPKGWHVDHIIPLASFSYSSAAEPEFASAWALTNLRPLWAVQNISKGARRLLLV